MLASPAFANWGHIAPSKLKPTIQTQFRQDRKTIKQPFRGSNFLMIAAARRPKQMITPVFVNQLFSLSGVLLVGRGIDFQFVYRNSCARYYDAQCRRFDGGKCISMPQVGLEPARGNFYLFLSMRDRTDRFPVHV